MKCACKLSPGNKVVGLPGDLRPRFLAGLQNAEVSSLLSASKHRLFRASSLVTHQEDPAERLYLLTSGQGRHFVTTNDGQKILLHWLSAGQIFGGAAMSSTPLQYLANTELLSDGCAVIWERAIIREFVSRVPRLLDNVLSIAITDHMAWLVAANISLSSDDARGRIAHLLISLASAIGKVGPDGIEIQVENEDLADGANVTPFTVSRSLKAWQREGLLTKSRGKILLRRPELLLLSR